MHANGPPESRPQEEMGNWTAHPSLKSETERIVQMPAANVRPLCLSPVFHIHMMEEAKRPLVIARTRLGLVRFEEV